MTYKTGSWGEKAKLRSKRRLIYFREYRKLHSHKYRKTHPYIQIGYKGQEEAKKILEGSKDFDRQIDLIWKDKLVDVKTAKPNRKCKKNYFWAFNIKKQKGKIDYFLSLCKDKNGKTKYIFLIPDKVIMTKTTLSISEKNINKFIKYLLRMKGGIK